jgi:hypothetical protein
VLLKAHDTPTLQTLPDAPQKVESSIKALFGAIGNDSIGTSLLTGAAALLWI